MPEDRFKEMKFRPIEAFKAVRRVIADPEQTDQVFRVLQSLSGPSIKRNFKRFARSGVGQEILKNKIDLEEKLNDRDYLKGLSKASLGFAYYQFIEKEQISADGLNAASQLAGYRITDADLDLFIRRTRASHDLFHVLTRYGREPLGEACLLAFTYGQTGNIAFFFILLMASKRLYRGAGFDIFPTLWRAKRDGRVASWLLSADWEKILELPLVRLRKELNIRPPVKYHRLALNLAQAN